MASLVGKVCLVTGATRGIGKGIALQLGEAGATVYITGRTLNRSGNKDLGSLTETAEEIKERGGTCIPVQCDHSQEEQTKQLFTRIKTEQNGQLDILVNNAYSAVKDIARTMDKKFWEYEPEMWDKVNNVGLRNHYYCSVYAARMMVENRSGLIVNISSMGGLRYIFNVPYGVGKAAVDRMAVDCGTELKKLNVACVSLWPGAVLTEIVKDSLESGDMKDKPAAKVFQTSSESAEFAGKCIRHLANDPNIMKKSARILLTGDLGDEYGLTDITGRHVDSQRQVNYVLRLTSVGKWLVPFIPNFVKLPCWMLTLMGGKL